MPKRRILLYLYVPVPSSLACTPIIRAPLAKLRNRARRAYDLWQWRARRKVTAEYSSHIDYKHSNRGDIAIGCAIQALIKNYDPTVDFEIKEVGWHSLSADIVHDINKNADMFVVGGGGYFYAGTEGKIFRLCHDDLPLIKAIKVPKFAFCVGVNRLVVAGMPDVDALRDERSLELLRAYSKTLDIIAVRDRYSMRSFAAAGAKDVKLVADPVFFWPDLPAHKAGFCRDDIINVGLNFAFHGQFSALVWRRNVETYLSFLLELSRRRPIRFVYFIHSDSERYIVQCLRAAGLKFEVVASQPKAMLAKYSKLDVHIGQMMHSCIMAASVHVPLVGLAYDMKNHGFFDMIGISRYIIDVNRLTIEDLREVVHKVIENRAELSNIIRYRQRELGDDLKVLLNGVRQEYMHLDKTENSA
jgi:polysaccharide pyruvyl transferase WcaK-like protein